MRQSYAPSIAPDGSSIAYIVRDGGYPTAVRCPVDGTTIGEPSSIYLPVEGPVTKVLHSPDGNSIACEVAPRGSERTVTYIVADSDDGIMRPKPLHIGDDLRSTLVEWDGRRIAMDAFTGSGINEARSVDARFGTFRVLDRRTDAKLISAEGGHALIMVGPRGNRELLLTSPEGRWLPLLPPDSGSLTDAGTILPRHAEANDLTVIVRSDHQSERMRLLRVDISHETTTVMELISSPDADVDEFVVSEDCSTAAVLWVQTGVSLLELFTLDEDLNVTSRRSLELPGMVASGLSITEDGSVLALTVEGPHLPKTVQLFNTAIGQDDSEPKRTLESPRWGNVPELVHYPARDGVELSGWLYTPDNAEAGPGPVYIHLHGGPENQSRPVCNDILTALTDSGVSVFTPNIRGSMGNGRMFRHADDRYGRLAAVRDVVDTAQFLVDAKVADPAAMVLGGRSYGGYLSLLTGSLYPGIFTGLIDACGMTSFRTYFASTEPWLASSAYPEYGYPIHDKELLERISPLNVAAQLDSPVLFIHGDGDTNVPPTESAQMRDALEARGVQPRFLNVLGEGHQFVRPASRALIARTMLEFLGELGMVSEMNMQRFDYDK